MKGSELFQPEKQTGEKGEIIMKKSDKEIIEKLKLKKDVEIDYSDIPETKPDFWKDAEVIYPMKKVIVKLNIDEDLAVWLEKMGKESDSAVNNLLRSYFIGVKNFSSR
jgi:uncharacterized protein (DUF4415 family)